VFPPPLQLVFPPQVVCRWVVLVVLLLEVMLVVVLLVVLVVVTQLQQLPFQQRP
jgi:hypothetical protein